MTPAVTAAKRAGIQFELHEYAHNPDTVSYGEEAAEKLGLEPERVFKTLVAKLDGGELVVGLVPVTGTLDLKALAAAAGIKKGVMAEVAEAERATGYLAGGISPLGQKKRLRTFIDDSAGRFETIFVSAGRRGLEIELAPKVLRDLCGAAMASIGRA